MLVLDKPGHCISDVNKNTLVFGIYLLNALDSNNEGKSPNDDWMQNFTVDGKTFGLFNVAELESITGYNFLSNIPTEIQAAIENRDVNDILTKLNVIKPASLMAATEDELKLSERWAAYDTAIGHSSLVNKITITPNNVWSDVSISKVSSNQNSELETPDVGSTEESTSSIHLSQVSTRKIGISQMTPTQVGGIQISIPDNGIVQPSAFQGNTKQIGSSQISSSQISLSQIGSTQVNISQNSPFEVNHTILGNALGLDQLNSSEVSFTISIPSQQLFSSDFPSHNLTSNFVSKRRNAQLGRIWVFLESAGGHGFGQRVGNIRDRAYDRLCNPLRPYDGNGTTTINLEPSKTKVEA